MSDRDPAIRALISKVAAHTRWANTADRTAATAPGRKAAVERFERLVDPDGTLDPAERARRADSARKAHYTRMALRSHQARRLRAQLAKVDNDLAEGDELEASIDEDPAAGDQVA